MRRRDGVQTEGVGRFPVWLRRPLSVHGQWSNANALIRELGLHTVCREALCPNLGECWSHGNVSFMIGGDRCTRRCPFCAVTTGRPEGVDRDEPGRLAEAVGRLGLPYVVVTAVARDDLEDEGSGLFAACVAAIRQRLPQAQVEVLTPDFHARPELIRRVAEAGPAVYNHNLETVRRLSRDLRPQADYDRSLWALKIAGEAAKDGMKTKSGFMLGLGESPEEVRVLMEDLRSAGCGILTIGQYLQPTAGHRPVSRFVPPEEFSRYREWGKALGFSFVASAPYVRSSYNAWEAFS